MMRQLVRSDGKVYSTISDAALEIVNENGCGKLDTTRANICNAANGHARSAYGFGWQWREPLGDAYDEALRKIARLEEVNGSLCAEINRQERVIEQLREKEAAYMDANHEQGMQLIEQGKRIRELESLVRDMDRDCRGCKYPCFAEKGSCGIIARIDELLGLEVGA